MSSDVLRISGLASPIDTEEMVSKLMKAERMKLDKVEQDKQLLVWKRELYNDVNKDFANFILDTRKDLGLTSVSYTGSYVSNSYENLDWIKSAKSSDESIATIDCNAKMLNGNYKVNVRQLAQGVTLASQTNIAEGDNIQDQFGLTDGDILEFTMTTKNGEKTFKFGNVDGADVKKDLNEISLRDVVKTINSATIKNIENGKEKEIPLGVKAMYDSNIDRFFLQTEDTGQQASIKIEVDGNKGNNNGQTFIGGLNLNVSHYEKLEEGKESIAESGKLDLGVTYTGCDAIINFAGAKGITQSSNQFYMNGMNLNLKKTGNFDISISTDTDKIYEKLKGFVDKYNEVLEKTGKLLNQKKHRDYKPLTTEQKKAMEKEDIELWEAKAKSGLIRNDGIISGVMQTARTGLYEKVKGVSGSFDHLTEIGITTQKYSNGDIGGKLTINEEKFKKALQDDVDGVMELLFKTPDYSSDELKDVNPYVDENKLSKEQLKAKRNQSGIITRLYDNVISGMKGIINKAGTGEDVGIYRKVKSNILIDFITEHGSISLIDEDVLKMENRIDDINRYLVMKENSYYAKFTAMEKAISRMNNQSMWLTQQFSN